MRVVLVVLALLLPVAFGAAPDPCGTPCTIRITSGPHSGNEVSIAIDPLDPLHLIVAAKDYGLGGTRAPCGVANVWIGVSVSHDGGITWTSQFLPGHDPSAPTILSVYPCLTDPVVQFAANGTAYIIGLAYHNLSAPSMVFVARSPDGGETWPTIVNIDERRFNDKPWSAVLPDDGTVLVAWTRVYSESGLFVSRAPGGDLANFTPPIPLDPDPLGPLGVQLASAGGQKVIAVWREYFSWQISRSYDSGAFFDTPTTLPGGQSLNSEADFRAESLPSLAVSGDGSRIYVAFHGNYFDEADALLTMSDDLGVSWTNPIRLSDDVNRSAQFFPALAVDPVTDAIHAVFLDERYDAGRRLLDLSYTTSRDRGVTWSPNQRLSPVSFDPDNSRHQSGDVFVGDYIGLTARGGIVRPASVDTRDLRADLYTAMPFAPPAVRVRVPADTLPGERTSVRIDLTSYAPVANGALTLRVPASWLVSEPDGATVSTQEGTTLTWIVADFETAHFEPVFQPLLVGRSTIHAALNGTLAEPAGYAFAVNANATTEVGCLVVLCQTPLWEILAQGTSTPYVPMP